MASSSPHNDGYEARLLLASRYENIEIAERALHDLCYEAGCSGDDEYWLVTALREAVANAIRHGNREHPERRVTVVLRISGSTVSIQVDDEGTAFVPEDVPDPTDPARLLQPSGRGIFYMRQFMDRVDFGRTGTGGTSVVMVREIQPITRSSHDEE